MIRQNLSRDEVLTVLRETKNKLKTARRFAISKETLDQRLREWGEFTHFRREKQIPTGVPIFAVGDRVIWRPSYSRPGFHGLPQGLAPWSCVVIRGPSASGYYTVRYDGPERAIRALRRTHEILGARLTKETP